MAVSTEHTDVWVATHLAERAAELLHDVRNEFAGAADHSPSDRSLGDRGDAAAHDAIVAELAALRPSDAVRSEESATEDLSGQSRVWIIDPLDGTREFSEGREDWAVHIALWHDGALACGAVALGSAANAIESESVGRVDSVQSADPVRLAVSRSRPSPLTDWVADDLEVERIPMGSAGVKILAVVDGTVDAYLHSGGQYEWDTAAPVAIARAAGLHVSRIDGSEISYNRPDPYSPDILVCRPDIAERILHSIAQAQRHLG